MFSKHGIIDMVFSFIGINSSTCHFEPNSERTSNYPIRSSQMKLTVTKSLCSTEFENSNFEEKLPSKPSTLKDQTLIKVT